MEVKLTEKKDTRKRNGLPHEPQIKSGGFTPKIEPLQGGILTQFKQCGRSNCRCAKGSLHGPYYYLVWMVRGVRVKKYVKKGELSSVQAGINERRRRLAEVRQINQEAKEGWRTFKAQLRQLDHLLKQAGYV
jgi:hypothetical protein